MTAKKTTPAKKRTPAKKAAPRKPSATTAAKLDPVNRAARTMDFDAYKAARAEQAPEQKGPRIKIGGIWYELPPVLPATYMLSLGDLQNGDMRKMSEMINQVFGKSADTIVALMDAEDMKLFVNRIPELYYTDQGE